MSKGYKKTLGISIIVILVLLAILYFLLFPKVGFGQNTIVYIKPTNCPETVCNVDSLTTWTRDIGIGLKIYTSDSVVTPSAIIFKDSSAVAINTQLKRAFMNDMCVLFNNPKACKIFESYISKTDNVTLNVFTSLFSVNDVRMKTMTLNLKNEFGNKLSFIPRYIILSNVNDPNVLMISEEIKEVGRQLCIANVLPATWVNYVSCIDNSLLNNQWTNTTWEFCSKNANVDTDKMNECLVQNGLTLVANEYNAVQRLGLTSSPVLFINNDVYVGPFNYEAMKKTVCMYFKEKPKGC